MSAVHRRRTAALDARPLPPRARAIVAALAVTQTVGYGSLYYSLPVFLTAVAPDLGVSRTRAAGAFTISVLTSAALAVPVGRWIDRRGSRGLMTAGSLLGSLLLLAFARVHTLTALYLVWAGIGAVSAGVFYEAAFATVITWAPAGRRPQALLAVTVVAGLASSIFLPLTSSLVDHQGWRGAAATLAVLHAAVTVPLHALVLRRPPACGPAGGSRGGGSRRAPAEACVDTHGQDLGRRRAAVGTALHDRRYRLLVAGFTAQSAATATMTIHLIGFLVSRGHRPTAAAALTGLLGVLSVTGRLVVTGLNRRLPTGRVVAAVFAVQSLAALALPVVGGSAVGAVAAVVCFGFGFGIASIARPMLLTASFGTAGYATLAGILAVPVTLALALAPLLTAYLQHAASSYSPVFVVVAGCSALAAVAVARSVPTTADGPAEMPGEMPGERPGLTPA